MFIHTCNSRAYYP